MRIIALDVASREVVLAEARGNEVVKRATLTHAQLRIELGPNTPKALVGFEAGRMAWHLYDWITANGHEVKVFDTTRVRRIGVGHHGRKNDSLDADALALAMARGPIPEAHVLSPARRVLREQLMARMLLVEQRTALINSIRGVCTGAGHRLPSCAADGFAQRTKGEIAALPEIKRMLLEPLINVVTSVQENIETIERKLEQLAAGERIIQVLMTLKGVGLMIACAFVAVVDHAERFPNAHALESYLGLVPTENSTGGKQRLGSITKQGNSMLRWLLIQGAWSLMRTGKDDPLCQWALQVAERRGNNVAVVALARRIAGVLWAMWRDNTVYDPVRVGGASSRGLRKQADDTRYRAEAMARAARKSRGYRDIAAAAKHPRRADRTRTQKHSTTTA